MGRKRNVLFVSLMIVSISIIVISTYRDMKANDMDIIQVSFFNEDIQDSYVKVTAKAQCLDGYEIKAMQVDNGERVDGVSEISFTATENRDYNVKVYYQLMNDNKEQSQLFLTSINNITVNPIEEPLADEWVDVNGISFNKTTGEIDSYDQIYYPVTELVIPDTIDGVAVTSIAAKAFQNRNKIVSITIPDTVTKIGEYAFYGCNALKSIKLPPLITEIPRSTFRNCHNLSEIDIPSTVTYIGSYAFADCRSLPKAYIPKEMTKIEEATYYGCSSISEISLSEKITSIGSGAFAGCGLVDLIVPESVTTIEDAAFGDNRKLIHVQLPSTLKHIGVQAFYQCYELTTVDIPKSLISIGDMAFYSCRSLPTLTIPKNVIEIGDMVFVNCKKLKTLIVPDTLNNVGESNLNGCIELENIIVMCSDPLNVDLADNAKVLDLELKSKNYNPHLQWSRAILSADIQLKKQAIYSIKAQKRVIPLSEIFESKGINEVLYRGKKGTEIYDEMKLYIPKNYLELPKDIDISMFYKLVGTPTCLDTKLVNNQLYLGENEISSHLKITATQLITTKEVPIKISSSPTITIIKEPLNHYIEGEYYQPEGLVINVKYDDGYEEKIIYNEQTKDDFSFAYHELETEISNQMITYLGQTVQHPLTVQSKYIYQTLIDEKNQIMITGNFTKDSYLVVEEVHAQYIPEDNFEIIKEYRIKIIGEYTGDLFIIFKIGEENDKKEIYIRSQGNDIQTYMLKSIQGKIGIHVQDLSLYSIYKQKDCLNSVPQIQVKLPIYKEELKIILTDDDIDINEYLLLIGTSFVTIVLLIQRKLLEVDKCEKM